MVRPTWHPVVRWGAGPIGSPSNFDPPTVEVAAATAYDNLGDLLASFTIRRGRTDPYQPIQAGVCTLTLKDEEGWFVPGHAASPLVAAGYLARLKTLRLVASHPTFGVSNGRFFGYLRRVVPNPDAKTATLEFADGLYRMGFGLTDGYESSPFGATTSGVLTQLVAHRFDSQYVYSDTAAGDAFSAVAEVAAGAAPLTLVNALLASERGQFFHSRDGVWTFLDRNYRDRPPYDAAQSTIPAAQVTLLSTGLDGDAVRNRATVQRTGGVAQTASAAGDDPSDWGSLTTDFLDTDAEALGRAEWIVAGQKDDQPVGYGASLDADLGDTVLGAMLSRDLGDRVSLDAIRVGESEYFIVGIEESVSAARKYTCRWLLQRWRAVDVGFVFEYSGFGRAAFGA